MTVDHNSFSKLLDLQKQYKLEYFIQIEEKAFALQNVKAYSKSAPVKKPTSRGGVYFSDVDVFKIKGTIYDPAIVEMLSKTMLGPNPEFKDLKIRAKPIPNNYEKKMVIIANLTNSIQRSSSIELEMNIIGIEENT